jgi:hypothetical protein
VSLSQEPLPLATRAFTFLRKKGGEAGSQAPFWLGPERSYPLGPLEGPFLRNRALLSFKPWTGELGRAVNGIGVAQRETIRVARILVFFCLFCGPLGLVAGFGIWFFGILCPLGRRF